MNTLESLREFFGWCAVLNICVLLFSTIMVIALRETVSRIHGTMFNLDEPSLLKGYFQYLAQYKIAMIVFSIVPYFALRIMS